MDALKLLREQAARKRDKAISQARDEFKQTLREIDTLGLRLRLDVRTTRNAPKRQPIQALILEHMPKDRPFALREVLAALQKAEPHRQFAEASVRTMFKRLIDDGLVRKVRKGSNGFMLWAALECPVVDAGPLATVSIADAIEYVLRERGRLRPMEILLAVQEHGYRIDAQPRQLLAALTMALRRYPKRFALGSDGKYAAV